MCRNYFKIFTKNIDKRKLQIDILFYYTNLDLFKQVVSVF